MIVFDTNILTYLLIVGDHTQEARSLYAWDSDWRSDAFLLIEFSNILATYYRTGGLSFGQTKSLLNEAELRLHNLISIPHPAALQT